MSRQEEIIQEFVLEQLDELGVDSVDCDINYIPAKGRKRAQIILTFPEDVYADVCEVMAPYLSELADDYSYTFTGTVTYKLCTTSDKDCLVDEYEEADDTVEDFADYAALAEPYVDGDVDDPDAQYAEEGLVIENPDDADQLYASVAEDGEDER